MNRFYSKNKKCKDCATLITNNTTRCRSCSKKAKLNPRFGIIIPDNIKKKSNKSGIDANNYIDGRTLKKYFCKDCGKELTHYSYSRCLSCAIKYLWTTSAYRDKIMHPRKNYSGQKHHNYIHGKGNDPYPLEFSAKLKLEIRERDNFTCQGCVLREENHIRGNKQINLIVHHIDYNKENCNEDNLITICNKCNIKANTNRDYWFAYFKYIIDNWIGAMNGKR